MGACEAKKKQTQQQNDQQNELPTKIDQEKQNLQNNNQKKEEKKQEKIPATPIGKQEATVISKQDINKFYEFKKYLGSGGFGIGIFYKISNFAKKVRLAQSKLNIGKMVAIKSIKNDELNSNFSSVKQELQILKQLDHPNVVKFFEIFEGDDYFHIVTEYCPNGDLLNYIYTHNLTEKDIKQIIYNLLLAVNHLHSHSICHRDIKPQNILFDKNNELKLIDFGLSIKMAENSENEILEKVGTLLYAAPEVLTGKYKKSCDVWSIGILLFIMLSGEIPYEYEQKKELYMKVKNGSVAFEKFPWKEVSEEASDLVRRFLTYDKQYRISINQALTHPWIKELNTHSKDLSPNLINNIYNNFMVQERFKKEVLKMVVAELSEEQILKLKNAFKKFDINNRGMISFQELEIAIKNLGLDAPESQISQIMKKIHNETSNLTPKQQQIHYTEFIASTLDFQKIVSRERLYALFKDITGDKQTFTKEDLKQFMARKGRKLSNECIQEMMNEIDETGIGEVGFQEFYEILLKTEKEEREENQMPVGKRAEKKSVSKILAINKNLQNEDLF